MSDSTPAGLGYSENSDHLIVELIDGPRAGYMVRIPKTMSVIYCPYCDELDERIIHLGRYKPQTEADALLGRWTWSTE